MPNGQLLIPSTNPKFILAMKKFIKGLGSSSKNKGTDDIRGVSYQNGRSYNSPHYTSQGGRDWTAKLSPPILERIFAFVCPHAEDYTYQSCEISSSEEGCMLCDSRDLAHCARVSKRWRRLACNVLYCSIRIDAVHYCRREELLSEKRKRGSFFDRNAEPEDTPQVRLSLLCRTLRDDYTGLGRIVRFLKIPYMTRETSKADLARILAVTHEIQYVDLPDGFFTDDPSCLVLKQEVQASCSKFKKMSYLAGSEDSVELLSKGTIWRELEVVELNRLEMDPAVLRYALGSLANLHALKITSMKGLDDDFFHQHSHLPQFPALTELLLEDTPNITATGIINYLFSPQTQNSLHTLSFTTTGVHAGTLHQILAAAPNLTSLSIIDAVTTAFMPESSLGGYSPPSPPSPSRTQASPLVSNSLRTLHYEITSATSPRYANLTASYYSYLTSSLLSNGLPNLKSLYVRDPDFPESLIDFAPPMPSFAGEAAMGSPGPGSPNRFSSNNPFANNSNGNQNSSSLKSRPSPPRGLNQQLEVYTKGTGGLEWNFSRIEASLPPVSGHRRGSSSHSASLRPISSYGLAVGAGQEGGGAGWAGGTISPSWTGNISARDVRRSIVVGNGMGGFLAVPEDTGFGGRPGSSSSSLREKASTEEWPSFAVQKEKKSERYDIWR